MNIKECKKWILLNKDEFIDNCGEYNYTAIAESLADHFNLYVDEIDYEIPEEVFDLVREEADNTKETYYVARTKR